MEGGLNTLKNLREIAVSDAGQRLLNQTLPAGYKLLRVMVGTLGKSKDKTVVEYEVNGQQYRAILAGVNYLRRHYEN